MANKDDYNDNVAVPFFPGKWLNLFTVLYVLIIAGFLGLKHWGGWGSLSNTSLGDISILTAVMFSATFVVGRFIYWRTHRDVEIGQNNVLDDLEEALENNNSGLSDRERLERIRQTIAKYRTDKKQ